MDYLLNYKNYTTKNALLWGNCFGHFKEAGKGKIGNRFVHALIGLAELPPIVGQVASLFEMFIGRFDCVSKGYTKASKAPWRT